MPDKPSIAVLPFQNMSGVSDQDYFADGVVEDIITGLSESSGFSSSPATALLFIKAKRWT
jgi:TolB-like protein